MLSASWVRAAASLALVALIIGACSDSSDDGDGSPGSAGTSQGSGEGGAAGNGASEGAAGDAGQATDPCAADPDSEACREVPWCGPFAITEVCGPTPFPLCPTDLADFVERTPCDSVSKLETYDTSCGGRVLIRSYPTRTESWEFDETDTLVSVMVEADVLHTCFEGGRSLSWLYGSEPCDIDPDSKLDACAGQGGVGGANAGGAGNGETVGGSGAGGAGGAP
jgi:hypothetical protein